MDDKNNNLNSAVKKIYESLYLFGNMQAQIQEKFKENYELWQKNKDRVIDASKFGGLASAMTPDYIKKVSKLTEYMSTLPDKVRKLQEVLAQYEWYFIGRMPFAGVDDITKMSQEEINIIMMEYTREIIPYILGKIERFYPRRYNIISDAIDAHNRGIYTLSVPVFFAQADGICYEMFRVQAFSKERYTGMPKTKNVGIIKKYNENTLSRAYLHSLELPILSRNFKPKKSNLFSRHGVLHGADTDYAKEINSLKCIALLNYFLHIREHFLEEK